MKFKLFVLPLLVVGLVLGSAGLAFGAITATLDAASNVVYTMDDAANELADIPLLVFELANTEATDIVITEVIVVNGAATVSGDEFEARIWKDANDNGILDAADSAISAWTALKAGATATDSTYIELTTAETVTATTGILDLIVTVKKPAANCANLDAIELLLDITDGGVVKTGSAVAITAGADSPADAA